VGAVASPTTVCSALGFDAEPARSLPPEIRKLILSVGEMEQAAASTAAASSELVFFSAKEAIHKALFPTTRVWMDFLDVELRIGSDPSVLTASGVGNAAPGLQDLVIRALHFDNLVITTAFLPAA
jgi:4'-phosphopantetheinyl transferase EntD